MGLRFRERRKCLRGEKTQICRERMREMNLIFALKLFKGNASRLIDDLSSTKSRLIESVEVLLRYCRESINDKNASMDRKTIEKLSAKQKISRWIENLSRSY